jgi:hypothetical protein
MFSKKLKATLSSIFSSALLFVTIGTNASVKAENKSLSSDQKSSIEQLEVQKTQLVNELKAKIEADYRANINKFEGQSHPGKGKD